MKIAIIAVGRLKEDAERLLTRRYLERFARIGPRLGLPPARVIEIAESRAATAEARQTAEAAELLKKCPGGCRSIALDKGGEMLSSEAFAQRLAAWRDGGVGAVSFLIGGPDGHGPALRREAQLLLSLGPLTLPHGLARVVLAEQLYRAATILAGHPYHRG